MDRTLIAAIPAINIASVGHNMAYLKLVKLEQRSVIPY